MFWDIVSWGLVVFLGTLVWWFATSLAQAHDYIEEMERKDRQLEDRLLVAREATRDIARTLATVAGKLRQARYDAEMYCELSGKFQVEADNAADELDRLREDLAAAETVIAQLTQERNTLLLERRGRLIVMPPEKIH